MIAPRKARMTIDLIRGKSVAEAQSILANTNTKASRLIMKVLNSAVANATNNLQLNEADLVVSECFVNPGQTIKRIKFGSKSRVDRHDHRTSHIVVKVSDGKVAEVKETKTKKEAK
ncbi:MAG TPA: 50S ribosomal protein L22 [Firmicutes bacterium]|nr:50S ribosomal protein L22 [Bacillota bacterium]